MLVLSPNSILPRADSLFCFVKSRGIVKNFWCSVNASLQSYISPGHLVQLVLDWETTPHQLTVMLLIYQYPFKGVSSWPNSDLPQVY